MDSVVDVTSSRIARAALALAIAAAALTACSPEPEPTPTPTGFSSEEEAFAAAEETYRAYVDALNAVDLADPETFEAVYQWTTGELNASDRQGLTSYQAEGLRVEGASTVPLIVPASFDGASEVSLHACLDVSDVQVFDTSNNSLVPDDRSDIQRIKISLTGSETSPTGLVISSIASREDGPPC